MRHPRAPGRALVAALLATVAVTGCTPAPATEEARFIFDLYNGLHVMAAGVGLFVAVLITLAIVRYRRRGDDDEIPTQVRGNITLELIWTGIPALIVAGIFAGTFVVLTRVDSLEAAPAAEVEVSAFRWGWSFAYVDEDVVVSGIGEPGPELVVPVREPVRIVLTSPDVIHSFYVPEFLFKRDAVPGRRNAFQFTVDDVGSYGGQCAEFCGVYHARMPFVVTAVERPEYEAWLELQRAAAAAPPTGTP